MKTIAISNQKGGVGKTSTCAAIGAGLHRAGQRVLYVDLDPQANLSAQLGADQSAVTITDVLTGKRKITYAIQDTAQGAIIPASGLLAGKDVLTGRGAEYLLRDALEPIKKKYDICLIDCPPSLGLLTVTALVAADGVIIPCKADRFSLDALQEISDTIAAVRARSNKRLRVYGVLVTMFMPRSTVQRVMLEELTEQATRAGVTVYEPPIRRAVAVEETQLGGTVYDTRNGAAEDYQQITNTILSQLKGA